jgi:hypothetical protein
MRIPSFLSATVLAALACLPVASEAAGPEDEAVVHWFRAQPSTIASGGSTTLHWHVDGADGVQIEPGIGAVPPAGSIEVDPSSNAVYTLTAVRGSVVSTATETVRVDDFGPASGARYVRLVSPLDGQRFLSPASLRVFAAAFDPSGGGGHTRNAARVDFFVDDTLWASVDGADSEFWVFKSTLHGVGPGTHRIWARAIYADPQQVLHSESVLIEVEPPPPYSDVIELDADVVLAGAQDYVVAGTAPDVRVRLIGNGHRIRSQSGWSGRFELAHVDVSGLGTAGDTRPAIEIANSGAVRVHDTIFDATGAVAVQVSGSATVEVSDSEFRSNLWMPIGQQPEFEPGASYPAFRTTAGSTGAKVFRGNRIGIGWADFRNTRDWTIGGDTDADANIAIGPRTGFWIRNTSGSVLRGNLSYHVYFGGWSQGNNVELWDSHDIVVEHNVIGGGSWPIRGLGGTFRYNLVLDGGHEWLWITGDGAHVHHNVFVDGDGDVAPIRLIYGPEGVRFHNNTLDGLDRTSMLRAIWIGAGAEARMRSNAIVGMRRPPSVRIDGELDADYSLFSGQQGGPSQNYSDNRFPPNDLGGPNGQVDPQFSEPTEPLRYRAGDWWTRRIGPRQVLANYRERYTPAAGSPLIDAGEPGIGAHRVMRSGFEAGEFATGGIDGNDIGAVGAGVPADDDRFGR